MNRTTAEEEEFGVMVNSLMQKFPSEACSDLLKCLSGLSSEESRLFVRYLLRLHKVEKQFRVVQVISQSPLEGKTLFLNKIRPTITLNNKESDGDGGESAQLPQQQPKKQRSIPSHLASSRRENNNEHEEENLQRNSSIQKMIASLSRSKSVRHSSMQQHHQQQMTATTNNTEVLKMEKMLSGIAVDHSRENVHLNHLELNNLLGKSKTEEEEEEEQENNKKKNQFALYTKRERPDSNWELMKDDQSAGQKMKPSELLAKESSSSSMVLDEQDLELFDAVINATKVEQLEHRQQHPEDTTVEKKAVKYDKKKQQEDHEEDGSGSPNYEDPDAPTTRRWTKNQDLCLRESVKFYGAKNWKAIAARVPGRNHAQRWRKVLKPGLVKGHWSFEEDEVLEYLIGQSRHNWQEIANQIPGRTPKQCRERWKNHLDPSINKGPYTPQEDEILMQMQAKLGNKWSTIAHTLVGRTEDSVKIRWKSISQSGKQNKKDVIKKEPRQSKEKSKEISRFNTATPKSAPSTFPSTNCTSRSGSPVTSMRLKEEFVAPLPTASTSTSLHPSNNNPATYFPGNSNPNINCDVHFQSLITTLAQDDNQFAPIAYDNNSSNLNNNSNSSVSGEWGEEFRHLMSVEPNSSNTMANPRYAADDLTQFVQKLTPDSHQPYL